MKTRKKDVEGALTCEDVEAAIWRLTGWRGDPGQVDRLLKIIHFYAEGHGAVFGPEIGTLYRSGAEDVLSLRRGAHDDSMLKRVKSPGRTPSRTGAAITPRNPGSGVCVLGQPQGGSQEGPKKGLLEGPDSREKEKLTKLAPERGNSMGLHNTKSTDSPASPQLNDGVAPSAPPQPPEAEVEEIELERVCSQCQELLPIQLFHRDRTKRGGRRAACKDCVQKWKRPS